MTRPLGHVIGTGRSPWFGGPVTQPGSNGHVTAPFGAPSWTADYGNETANHFDHVHIATDGGGYPTGRETYYMGSMRTN